MDDVLKPGAFADGSVWHKYDMHQSKILFFFRIVRLSNCLITHTLHCGYTEMKDIIGDDHLRRAHNLKQLESNDKQKSEGESSQADQCCRGMSSKCCSGIYSSFTTGSHWQTTKNLHQIYRAITAT